MKFMCQSFIQFGPSIWAGYRCAGRNSKFIGPLSTNMVVKS